MLALSFYRDKMLALSFYRHKTIALGFYCDKRNERFVLAQACVHTDERFIVGCKRIYADFSRRNRNVVAHKILESRVGFTVAEKIAIEHFVVT